MEGTEAILKLLISTFQVKDRKGERAAETEGRKTPKQLGTRETLHYNCAEPEQPAAPPRVRTVVLPSRTIKTAVSLEIALLLLDVN